MVYDGLLLLGLALLGAALVLWWGPEAGLAYAGVVCIAVGVMGAWLKTQRGRRG